MGGAFKNQGHVQALQPPALSNLRSHQLMFTGAVTGRGSFAGDVLFEEAGVAIIQIDEAALREGLPLRRGDWAEYLHWAVECFCLTSCVVRDETQIHTHMCYSEFNDIIEAITQMDADVISIESSRSRMELLQAFDQFDYPNEVASRAAAARIGVSAVYGQQRRSDLSMLKIYPARFSARLQELRELHFLEVRQ